MTSEMNMILRLKISMAAIVLISTLLPSSAQEADSLVVPDGYILADSVVVIQAARVDTTLAGQDIFSVMPSRNKGDASDVKVHQSQLIRNSLAAHISSNPSRITEGYRVRIFFDNRQSARTESEKTEKKFIEAHPDIPAYRSYANPYFKVTVGDFRNRSEAMQLLRSIVQEFPTAFVVKENINYPAVDRFHPTVTDTIQVLRPIQGQEVSL